MPTIKRATIKSYDPAANKATVQVAGSLAVWLDAVPVSVAIAPEDVIAGRECGVLFFTGDDPGDAAVITIHNVPAPAGHSRIRDADQDTRVETEASADEDKIRLTIAGTLRYVVQTTTPHHQFSGDVDIDTHLAVGPGASPLGSVAVNIIEDRNNSAGFDGINNIVRQASSGDIRGVTGEVQAQASAGTLSYLRGLDFRAQHSGAGNVTDHHGAQVEVTGAGPATNRRGVYVKMNGLVTGLTVASGIESELIVNVTSATYPLYKMFRSAPTVSRSTISELMHYAVENPTIVLGGAIARQYGYYSPNLTSGANGRHPFWDAGVNGSTSSNSGNRFRSNSAFGTLATSNLFGAGDGVLHIADATVVPGGNPAGGVIVYSAGQDLVLRGSGGHLVTLPATTVPNVSGSRGGNAALANLLTTLATMGLITDSTT